MFPEQQHPYKSWLKSHKPRTQNDVYVRDTLSTKDYLLKENRINLGPVYNYRKQFADTKTQIPMEYGTPDMWGWEKWVRDRKVTSPTPSPTAPTLYPRVSQDIFYRGCSSCRRPRK